jgi:hypothetical protein
MSLTSKAPTPVSRSWRELTVFMRETHPAFDTTGDYRRALCFFTLGYPKLQDILNDCIGFHVARLYQLDFSSSVLPGLLGMPGD